MGQLLLIPDPRPLNEPLGRKFFRQAPKRSGVYLMRDAADKVLYVGKAKNLRQRLGNYWIANPDRIPRRHRRMLRQVARIEFQFCPGESAALQRESKLLRALKPRFNRAGVWPGKTRFIVWRLQGEHLELATTEIPGPDWQRFGPLGASGLHLHRTLLRLLWLALNPTRPYAEMPAGWAQSNFTHRVSIHCRQSAPEVAAALTALFWQSPGEFMVWLAGCLCERTHSFERTVIESELETLKEFSRKQPPAVGNGRQLALL